MARKLLLVSGSGAKVWLLKDNEKSPGLVVVKSRLYRTIMGDCAPRRVLGTTNEVLLYDVESTQPYGTGEYQSVDVTQAMIHDVKAAFGKKAITRLDVSKWYNIFVFAVVGIIIAYALLNGVM